jgi:hypothetical protein
MAIYKYHVTAKYEADDGITRIYRGTYKSEKSAKKRIDDLHKWFPKVYEAKITIIK